MNTTNTKEHGKHTPGTWEVTKDHPVFEGKTIVVVWDEENSKSYRDKYKMICELTEIRGDSFTDNSEYTKANAALIASAPELLKENEQLKEQVKVLREALRITSKGIEMHQFGFDDDNSEWGILEGILTDISSALEKTE